MKQFCLFLSSTIVCLSALAQIEPTGTWTGKLTVPGGSLRLVVHIQKEEGIFTATLDSPDQGAKGIPFSRVHIAGDSVVLELTAANARYSGRLTSDTTLHGQWVQGASLPLHLKKARDGETAAQQRRPQTPTPPFPYQSTDVVYANKDKSIQYGATLTKPKGKGPFPALLLLTGSGPQNRDEELFGHKPFAVIADYLTKRGYIVLRADDRGIGQTTGNHATSTTKDFADDALAGLAYLRSLPEVDSSKIGLLGHSEGGMMAQMVAAQQPWIDFIILLAAPGEKLTEVMTAQNKEVLLSMGMPADLAAHYLKLYKPLVTAIAFAPSDTAAQTAAMQTVNAWLNETPEEAVQRTTGIRDEKSKQKFVDDFLKATNTPWYRYFLRYDPGPIVRNIKAKVLALNGDKDIQVPSGPNLAALKTSLQKGRSQTFEVMELKGLNHLFQHCQKCTVAEYAELEETIAPEALEVMGKWLEKNVK